MSESKHNNEKAKKIKAVRKSKQGKPTDEEIVELRKLRAIKRLEESTKPKTQITEDPDINFIKRHIVRLPDTSLEYNDEITIMTYNILAQCLIRRNLFPLNDAALKWKNRSKMIERELSYYSPTILCLQEVDLAFYDSFYDPLLRRLGYQNIIASGDGKLHGLVIAAKISTFDLEYWNCIKLDSVSRSSRPVLATNNIAIIAALRLKANRAKGVLLATTHLFWHPYGSVERMRQAAIVVTEIQTLRKSYHSDWPLFICGDFNTSPSDMTYTALTARPIHLSAQQIVDVENSLRFDFADAEEEKVNDKTKLGIENEVEAEAELENELLDKRGGNEILPTELDIGERNRVIAGLSEMHMNNPPLKSMYSIGLSSIQPNTTGLEGEPKITNCAARFKDCLDYIFCVQSSDKLNPLECSPWMSLTGLLRMPEDEELGRGRRDGIPILGIAPSDHLAIMASFGVYL